MTKHLIKLKKLLYLAIGLMTCSAAAQQRLSFKPLSIGVVAMVESKILHETRTINIYLPAGYREQDTTRYPVIYVPDGGIDEDFLHLAGLAQYAGQPWVGRLRPSIVVGIANTNRQRDFTFAVNSLDFLKGAGYTPADIPVHGGSANYIAFLEKELQPMINSHFPTDGHNTIVGESLAGLLATEIYLCHRNLFDRYIIISPSLWWGGERLLKQAAQAEPEKNSRELICIAAPGMSEDTLMYREAVQLKSMAERISAGFNRVFFDYLPVETHATVIHQAVYDAFRHFAPGH